MSKQLHAVAVTSGHQIAADRIESSSLEEMIFEVTSTAIARAGLTPEQVDAVVISGNDQTDGRIISCMVTVGSAGGVGKNVTTVASSPEHAFILAVLRLLSGQGKNAVVVGWSKPSESVHPEHGELVGADPFLVRPIGMNRVIAAALQASRFAGTPSSGDEFTAWPIQKSDVQSHADGVCAMVLEASPLSQAGDFGRDPKAWVRGIGWAMDRYEIGDRDDNVAGGLDLAMSQAMTQAGQSYGPVQTLEAFAVGLTNERRMTQRVVENIGNSDTLVNSSGDYLNPDFAAGLFTIWRAAEGLLERDQDLVPHSAAAVVTLGFAAQGTTVVLLSDSLED